LSSEAVASAMPSMIPSAAPAEHDREEHRQERVDHLRCAVVQKADKAKDNDIPGRPLRQPAGFVSFVMKKTYDLARFFKR
jgi:hypothetical protein